MNTDGKGYVLAIADGSRFYIPNALHVERDVERFRAWRARRAAAKAAEQDGVRLIHGMDGVPDGVYLDTPENREIIHAALEKFPEYRFPPPAEKPALDNGVHLSLL